MTWNIMYNSNGENFLEKWLNKLNLNQLKSVSKELELLRLSGNQLRLPHSKSMMNGLFELRERSHGFRIYYTFLPNKTILLLTAGDKNSQKKDIKLAQNILSKIRKR